LPGLQVAMVALWQGLQEVMLPERMVQQATVALLHRGRNALRVASAAEVAQAAAELFPMSVLARGSTSRKQPTNTLGAAEISTW